MTNDRQSVKTNTSKETQFNKYNKAFVNLDAMLGSLADQVTEPMTGAVKGQLLPSSVDSITVLVS